MCNQIMRAFCQLLLVLGISTNTFAATSLYVCPNWNGNTVSAYQVNGSSLTYQTDCTLPYGLPVGVGIDSQQKLLLVTMEFTNKVDVIDARSMQRVKTLTIANTDDNNLSGIAGTSDGQFYVVERYTNRLWSLSYDNYTQTCEYDFAFPYYVELPDLEYDLVYHTKGAFGIALDETNDLLYVTDNTTTVKAYNTSDWSHASSHDATVSHQAIGVAVDVAHQYLYSGSIDNYGQGSQQISLYNMNNDTEYTLDLDVSVAGIAVDQSTSLIYLTTSMDTLDESKMYSLFVFALAAGPSLTQQGDPIALYAPTGLAVSPGISYKPSYLFLSKNDQTSAYVEPNDTIEYRITYGPNGHDANNVILIDHLPVEVDPDLDPNDLFHIAGGDYDPVARTITWDLDDLSASASNANIDFSVTVNRRAKPGHTINNHCLLESDEYYNTFTESTPVDCWANNNHIIYVRVSATGFNNGSRWEDAYTNLQDALCEARHCSRDPNSLAIWVAQGTYAPTQDANALATFSLIEGVPLYGGFLGDPNDDSLDDRRPALYPTVLTGNHLATRVVTADSTITAATILDGFTVTGAANDTLHFIYGAGIYCDQGSPVIRNCRVVQNIYYGFKGSGSDALISHCLIENNITGIYCDGGSPAIANSRIRRNASFGIAYDNTSDAVIKNNWIHDNGTYGISLDDNDDAIVRNNTIVNNAWYGIADGSSSASVSNCILWDNNGGNTQFNSGGGITWSCIQGGHAGDGNINPTDPNFAYPNTDDFHLLSTSLCKNACNPNFTPDANETDIDDKDRKVNNIVDMGADEVDCNDVSHPLDLNADGIINMHEFADFAKTWLYSDPNELYNDFWDLVDDGTIDLDDLVAFCDVWLWKACWRGETYTMGNYAMNSALGQELSLISAPAESALAAPEPEPEPADPAALADWLTNLYKSDEDVRNSYSQTAWQDFVNSVQNSSE